MIKMSYNRCKDIHKFGNKYLPSAFKMQVEFRSHFSGKKSASYGPRNTVFMQSINNCRPQQNYISRAHNFATIQWLQFMIHVTLFPMVNINHGILAHGNCFLNAAIA